MGLYGKTDLNLALLDESGNRCNLLSFEEDNAAPAGSPEESGGAVIPDCVTELPV